MMNPWQQLKLTFLTLGSVLRGNALAPASYKPVPSAVRDDAEATAMLDAGAIKGGIKVSSQKVTANGIPAKAASTAEERETVGV